MSIDDVHPDVIDELDAELGADLRAARDAAPLPVLGAALARVFEEGLPPVAVPAPATGPSARRRTVRRAAVLGGVAAFFAGGLGVAGALPGPVQRAVSDVADVVGVQLPHPADDDADPADDADTPADTPVVVPPTTVDSTPPTSAVRPTPPSTVPPPAVDPGESRGTPRGRGPEKDGDKGAEKPPKPEIEDDEPEVELEQQHRGNGKANGRTGDGDAVPATRGSGNGKGQDRDKGVVEELLDIVEDPAPGP